MFNEDLEKFEEEKNKILNRADLSRKGSVDAEIKDIVDLLNKNKDYCTTSSCAGRIMLLEKKSHKKIDSKWIISSHQTVTFEEIKKNLHSKHDTWLLQESCILHVMCRTLESAEKFLLACRNSGFKRSGILSVENKIMIETMGNEKLETIVIKEGKVLVDDDYLKVLVNESNKRMKKNREKMLKLYEEFKKI